MTTIESATFEMLPEPPIPEWVMRVTVKGTGLELRAIPLMAVVGGLPVVGIQHDADLGGFVGFLPMEPQEGDALRLGHADEELVDTGFAYHRLVA